MKKLYCVICCKYRKLEKPFKIPLKKTQVLSIIWSKCKNEDEKIFREEDSIEMFNIFGFIENI